MHSILLFTSSLLTTAYALPALDFIHKRATPAPSNPLAAATCDLSGAQMPQASTPLPAPSQGLVLTHVAVGRGTQNYTCADNTANSIPAPNGATATLFNVTCMATPKNPYPQILSGLPAIALRYPIPTAQPAAETFLTGHHWFTDKSTPFFNLDTPEHQWGSVACKKDTAVNAPNPTADVPWLKLTAKSATGCTISEVYRLNTAGGQPPANCKGQPANFEVPYAAAYWFWSGPAATSY